MALLNCNFCSAVLGMNTQVTVLLPERRHQPRKLETQEYPVLYALHGLGQDHTNWQRDGMLEYLLKDDDVVVVMPNGNKSFYVNGEHGYEYFTYLTEELPIILANYFHVSNRREDTYLAGISMGGYGALHAAFLRPDLYGSVAALSGGMNPGEFLEDRRPPVAFYSCNDFYRNLESVFGTVERYRASLEYLPNAYDARAAVECGLPKILLTCGRQDPLYEQNVKMRDYMAATGTEVKWIEHSGEHNWAYWNKVMPEVLGFFGFGPLSKKHVITEPLYGE